MRVACRRGVRRFRPGSFFVFSREAKDLSIELDERRARRRPRLRPEQLSISSSAEHMDVATHPADSPLDALLSRSAATQEELLSLLHDRFSLVHVCRSLMESQHKVGWAD